MQKVITILGRKRGINMYASPIEKIYGELQTQMVQEDENMVVKAVREVGINVDKEELINALRYDRKQYTKGYEDGKNEVLDKIRAEITNIPITDTDGHNNNWHREPQAIINDVLQIIDKYKVERNV